MKANLEIEINSPEIAKRAIAIEKPKNSSRFTPVFHAAWMTLV